MEINLSQKQVICEATGELCKRHSEGKRKLHDLGRGRPRVITVTYSKHYSKQLGKHFSVNMEHLAGSGCRFTNKVKKTAVNFIVNDKMTLRKASETLLKKHYIHVPQTTMHDWVQNYLKERE